MDFSFFLKKRAEQSSINNLSDISFEIHSG